MRIRLRLLASLLALLLPALVLWRWVLLTATPVLPSSLPEMPQQVGPWRVTLEDRLDEVVLAQIDPDHYSLRLYEADGHTPIWLYLGIYAARTAYGSGAHDPETCYPAQGWEVTGVRSLALDVGSSGSLHAKLLETQNGSRREAVLYWFQPARRWPATATAEELLRIGDAIAGRPQYAFVRLSAPLVDGWSTLPDLEDLARRIAPPVRELVEAIELRGTDRLAGDGPRSDALQDAAPSPARNPDLAVHGPAIRSER